MTRRWWLSLTLCATLFLVGCQNSSNIAVSNPVDTSKIEQAKLTPEQGKTTVVGRIMSSDQRQALSATQVWLAAVHRTGDQAAFVLDGARSPSTNTDEEGIFVISNVNASEYVLVVGDPYAKNVIVQEASGDAKVWQTQANQVLNVGEVIVDFK